MKRDYGIDLLRIISTFLIVMHHIITQGGVLDAIPNPSVTYYIIYCCEIICYISTNCFALISGYVGIHSKYKYSNFIMLWFTAVFYSLIILFAAGKESFSLEALLRCFVPVLTLRWWYFSGYFMVFACMPIMNTFVKNITYKQFKLFIIVLLLCSTASPFLGGNDPFSLRNGYSGIWLCILYLIGAGLAHFKNQMVSSKQKSFYTYIICVVCILIGDILLSTYFPQRSDYLWRSYISPLFVLGAVSLILLFSDSIKKPFTFLALLSSLSFGIYIIHTHPIVFSLMSDRFAFIAHYNPLIIILLLIFFTSVVYSICAIFDYLRSLLFNWIHLKQLIIKVDKKYSSTFWE